MVERNRVIQELPADFAPYAATSNVMAVITRKRDRGLQIPIGVQVLETIGIPLGNASRTLQALRFLGLMDDYGHPTEQFEHLCRAGAAGGQYQESLREAIRLAYEKVFTIVDPVLDDDVAIQDAFRQFEPSAQRNRMITFFLGMCEESGITEGRVRTRRSPVKRRQGSGGRQRPKSEAAQPQEASLGIEEFTHEKAASPAHIAVDQYPLVQAVIQQLPSNHEWTKTRREMWLRALEAAVDLVIDVVDSKQSAPNAEEAQ